MWGRGLGVVWEFYLNFIFEDGSVGKMLVQEIQSYDAMGRLIIK